MSARPPLGHQLAGLLLLRIAAGDREALAGDLAEHQVARSTAGQGRLAASWAYWLELAGVLITYRRPEEPSLAPPPHHPRQVRGVTQFVEQLSADLRQAWRGISRAPLFAFLAVFTLALGIGATTAMFSVLRPVLLAPLPYPAGDRLALVWEREEGGTRSNVGYATYRDLREQSRSLAQAAVLGMGQVTLEISDQPERLQSLRVSRDYFSVLGVGPVLGRDFLAEEDLPDASRVAILSHGLWQRRFAGDPTVIGRSVVMSQIPFTIVGVMGAEFRDYLAPQAELWTTLRYDAQPWACRTCRHLRMLVRLAPETTPANAQRELDLISERIVAANPADYAAAGTVVVPLESHVTAGVRGGLWAAATGIGFVLLIAVANVVNLQLGRAARRRTEFAVRGALGAGRWQVMRQLLTENLLLAAFGAIGGLFLAWLAIAAIRAAKNLAIPRLELVALDLRVLAFAAMVTVGSGLLMGLLPAAATFRPDLRSALAAGGRGAVGGRHRLRSGVVVAEVAVALVLLTGAGLMIRSLERLLAVDVGFQPAGLLTLQASTAGSRRETPAAIEAYAEQTLAALAELPGVESAAWTSMLPFGGEFNRYGILIASQPLENPSDAPSADRYLVSANYHATMGIALRQGRHFDRRDRRDSELVVLINETFATRSWPHSEALGDRVQLGGPDQPWRTIVGVVGDVKHGGLDDDDAPQVYLPIGQRDEETAVLVVRTRGEAPSLAAMVHQVVTAVDKTVPVSRVVSVRSLIDATTASRRYAMTLFTVFAAVGLLLAAAGIYGVVANNVGERTREIGIRSALGAARTTILGQFLGQGLRLTLVGIALGGLGALVLGRLLRGLLFGVAATDPLTLAAVATLLLTTALVACWVPALRAASVPPSEALRDN